MFDEIGIATLSWISVSVALNEVQTLSVVNHFDYELAVDELIIAIIHYLPGFKIDLRGI